VVQEVESLSRKPKVLSSNTSTTKTIPTLLKPKLRAVTIHKLIKEAPILKAKEKEISNEQPNGETQEIRKTETKETQD
jgi:hypothetical protein